MTWRDRWLGALALLATLQVGLSAAHLLYPDLNLDYPFLDGDSHDWIANGLRISGYDVRFSGRAPLLPLVIAALETLSALAWLPVLLLLLFHATVLAFYGLAAHLFPRRAAFAASLALLVNHSLLGISLQVMADVPASCLLLLAARSFLLAREDPGRYGWAGLWAGLSVLTQPVGLLTAVPAALTVALRRREALRSPGLWRGAAALLALPALGLAVRLFGGAGDADIPARQWGLVSLHAGSVPFYAWALLSLLGLPACLLLAAGLALAIRKAARGGDAPLFVVGLFTVLTGFFVFLYSYDAKRFLVYPVWMAGLLLAGALARLPVRAPFGLATVLLVAGSALPLPGEPTDPAWAALWPLPPVYARAPIGSTPAGGQTLAPGPVTAGVLPLPPANLQRIRSAREAFAPQSARLEPGLLTRDRSALYLHQSPADGGGRYRTLTRLGNALRKRVKYVPASWLAPWNFETSPLGRIGPEYHVYRGRLPEIAETWLVVTPEPLVRKPSRSPAGGLREAEAINAHLEGWDGYVALVPGTTPEPWQLYLPFLVETTELYVSEPGQESEILEIFARAPNLGERRFGSVLVRRTELLGRRASLVSGRPLRGTAAPLR